MPARNAGVVAYEEFSGPVLAPLPQVVPARMRQYCFLPTCKVSRGYGQQPKCTRKKMQRDYTVSSHQHDKIPIKLNLT